LNSPYKCAIALRLEPEIQRHLDQVAKAWGRNWAFVATAAVRDYVAVNEWQIKEIRKALEEAEREDFAKEQQVRRTVRKWRGRKRANRDR